MTAMQNVCNKLKKYKPALTRSYGIKTLGIFGSYARGEQKNGSDLDVLIEFEKPIGLLAFVALENSLSARLGKKVDLVMKSSLKPFIGRRILSEVRYI